ncbi:phosphatase PAP2 family protein [Hydrogenophaga sp.]|jgi:undecaprenyl-diphosphatase|uniref:phosphatase PAP2 family protein n=1 Tax=Hydrogenophaga sp. TaxID=1904254 RepID=UPI00391DC9B6
MNLNEQAFLAINLGSQASALWVWLAQEAATQLLNLTGAAIVLGGVLGRGRWRTLGRQAALAMAGGFGVARLITHLVYLPRPQVLGLGHQWLAHAATSSLPSAHSTVAAALGAVWWWALRGSAWRWAGPALALLVGWGRVAVGVHFPADVLAGWLLGAACAGAAIAALPSPPRAQPGTEPLPKP